jgi:hypothetical protein
MPLKAYQRYIERETGKIFALLHSTDDPNLWMAWSETELRVVEIYPKARRLELSDYSLLLTEVTT